MQGREADDTYVVSSLVVHTRSERTAGVEKVLNSLAGAEIVNKHGHKFAVVLETKSTESAAELTERIRSTDGVTGVELVAHFFEEEVLDNLEQPD